MAKASDITPELCRQLLSYDPATGKLEWRARPVSMFTDSPYFAGMRPAYWAANCWNHKNAGKEAFTAVSHGYRRGAILGANLAGHRVAWAIYHGAWPPEQIDHINGDRSDNRLLNLRAVSNSLNHRNEGKPKNNTSGVTGVLWCKDTGKWRAMIKLNYRTRCLGRYNTIAEAASAREKAISELGFDRQHGKREAFTE